MLIGDLATKIGQGILLHDFMDREYNLSTPHKVIGCCDCKGICCKKCLIYQLKFMMCDVIYIGNTKQTLKKGMDVIFSDVQKS